jgi:hypothetical protein
MQVQEAPGGGMHRNAQRTWMGANREFPPDNSVGSGWIVDDMRKMIKQPFQAAVLFPHTPFLLRRI